MQSFDNTSALICHTSCWLLIISQHVLHWRLYPCVVDDSAIVDICSSLSIIHLISSNVKHEIFMKYCQHETRYDMIWYLHIYELWIDSETKQHTWRSWPLYGLSLSLATHHTWTQLSLLCTQVASLSMQAEPYPPAPTAETSDCTFRYNRKNPHLKTHLLHKLLAQHHRP